MANPWSVMARVWLVMAIANAFAAGMVASEGKIASAVASAAIAVFACVEVMDCFKRKDGK